MDSRGMQKHSCENRGAARVHILPAAMQSKGRLDAAPQRAALFGKRSHALDLAGRGPACVLWRWHQSRLHERHLEAHADQAGLRAPRRKWFLMKIKEPQPARLYSRHEG